MAEARPTPAELLTLAADEERRKHRGKLKIFFGAAPGVGKTYAMLEEARRLYSQGADVAIGYVEPHARAETMALTLGLEVIPSREVEYRGAKLKELDLDAVLARRPGIVVVDELAHTNAPGSKFQKRYQDVEALLDAGLNVYTTLNVQHVESLSDIVAQITDVSVRETVPDATLDEANEVELIDLPPDALLERLREGKVYVHEVAREAVGRFFRRGNLAALRELALRRTARWVDAQMRNYKREQGVARVWPASERILVVLGADPHAASVLRAAKRLAVELRADLLAAYVETPLDLRLPQKDRERILQELQLAERLGAETVTLSGTSVAETVVEYATSRNVTKVVVGRSRRPWLLERILGSVATELVQASEGLDVFVVHDDEGEREEPARARAPLATSRSGWRSYTLALAIVAASTGVAALMAQRFELTNVAMVYLVGVLAASVTCGRAASALASVLSVAAFDFFFVPPTFTFAVRDTQYLITFLVMLSVAMLISSLTARIRDHAEEARARERRTAALYAMSRELAAAREEEEVLAIGARHLREVFDASVAILLPGSDGKLGVAPGDRTAYQLDDTDQGAAQWAFDHGEASGAATATLPAAQGLYVPLLASHRKIGVLGLRRRTNAAISPVERHLLDTFANQVALALERAFLIREAQGAQLRAERERLRNALLSSVSHDLRTPLAVIKGSVSLLQGPGQDEASVRSAVDTIGEEVDRLNQIINNLVFATRLESRTVDLHTDWISIEEVVGAALHRLRERIRGRAIDTAIAAGLPLVRADGALIEQVVVNLLENALRYAPATSPIEIAAWKNDAAVVVQVRDRGPGIATEERQQIFERFYRGQAAMTSSGLGLGLYICRGIVTVHGGRIWSEDAPGGGAAILFTLPLANDAPAAAIEASRESSSEQAR